VKHAHAWHVLIGSPRYRRSRSRSVEKRMKHSGAQTRPSAHGPLGGSCMDCGIDAMARGEYYALKDSVWQAINPLVIGHLCLECVEDRLGRSLHRGDFSSARINTTSALKCRVLAQRLQRMPPSAPRDASRQPVTRRLAKFTYAEHARSPKRGSAGASQAQRACRTRNDDAGLARTDPTRACKFPA